MVSLREAYQARDLVVSLQKQRLGSQIPMLHASSQFLSWMSRRRLQQDEVSLVQVLRRAIITTHLTFSEVSHQMLAFPRTKMSN